MGGRTGPVQVRASCRDGPDIRSFYLILRIVFVGGLIFVFKNKSPVLVIISLIHLQITWVKDLGRYCPKKMHA